MGIHKQRAHSSSQISGINTYVAVASATERLLEAQRLDGLQRCQARHLSAKHHLAGELHALELVTRVGDRPQMVARDARGAADAQPSEVGHLHEEQSTNCGGLL